MQDGLLALDLLDCYQSVTRQVSRKMRRDTRSQEAQLARNSGYYREMRHKGGPAMGSKVRVAAAKFWSELKHRRVIKTAVAYVIGAWVLVEVSSVVFPALLLPDWTVRITVTIAILALPLVLVLAWFFDIEREPEKAAKTSSLEASPPEQPAERDQSNVPPVLTSAVASVAVLPFENLSPDKERKFLADGIAVELHSTLTRVHRLNVAARTSSFVFASGDTDIKEIARKLNVHFIISGSVRSVDDHMRVIVELDNAVEGVQIWSETFDREVQDVFSVQHDIAHAVTSAFGGARLRDEIASATSRPTSSLDAWSLVQRARSYVLEFTPQVLADAVPLLRQAIVLDAEYAAAHSMLACALSEQVLNGLSTAPRSDRDEALESAERAFTHSPVDPFVLKMCGAVWAYFGKTEDSLRALHGAVEIAPFDFGAWGYMGWPLVETGVQRDLEELHEIMERILQATPLHPGVPYWLYHQSVAYACEGEDQLALDFARKSIERNPTFPWVWMHYANSLGRTNAADEARRAIQRSSEISPALTPEYYESMIRDMSANNESAALRLAGLREARILGE
jgi:adenylate cyclase